MTKLLKICMALIEAMESIYLDLPKENVEMRGELLRVIRRAKIVLIDYGLYSYTSANAEPGLVHESLKQDTDRQVDRES